MRELSAAQPTPEVEVVAAERARWERSVEVRPVPAQVQMSPATAERASGPPPL